MKGITNSELLAEYTLYIRAERGLRPLTIAAYVADLWQYAEVLELRGVTLFTAEKDDVAAFLQHLTEHGIEARSRSRKIASLRSLYKWLLLTERLDKDPMRITTLPKTPKLLPRPVDERTLDKMMRKLTIRAEADDATALELRNVAILDTLYTGGIRVSELCGIREQDISLSSQNVIVRGKGDKERIVPLGSACCAAIEEYLQLARPKLQKFGKGLQRALFLSEQGTQISRRQVWNIVRAAGGQEHLHPHRLRHSCATHMLNGNADLRVVQDMLGHATLATTQIYTQVSKGALQNAHRRSHPRG